MEALNLAYSLMSSNNPKRGVYFEGSSTEWTREENKLFESALAIFDDTTPNRWDKVAAMIPGKSLFDIIKQYKELENDVTEIEAGRVPRYFQKQASYELACMNHFDHDDDDDDDEPRLCLRKKPTQLYQERKKGVPWTKDEHRRFLLGLMKYGKGDWRSISRDFVMTKTPTQVASHAQKYYLRQVSVGKDKRRPSIHDFTIGNLTQNTCPTISNSPISNLDNWDIRKDEQEMMSLMSSTNCANFFMSSSSTTYNGFKFPSLFYAMPKLQTYQQTP